MADQPLSGKTALVTGSGKGMGASHARMLADRGADVIVHDIDAPAAADIASQIEAMGRRAAVIETDIADISAFTAAVAAAESQLAPVDILVNNAGVGGQGLKIEEIDEATFDRLFSVHVKGAFFATRAVVPGMKERKSGRIINISSNFAMGGAPFASHYAAAKSALSGFTKCWAQELAPWNICVNAVAPGILETTMTVNSIGKERIHAMGEEVPIGRIAQPEDISFAVCWLASSETDMISGQVISPNGGVTIPGI